MTERKDSICLWLDDRRAPTGDDWTWVKTVPEAIAILEHNVVTDARLDNDLGLETPEGYTLCNWMAEHQTWPTKSIYVQSDNAPALRHMIGIVARYGPYRQTADPRHFVAREA